MTVLELYNILSKRVLENKVTCFDDVYIFNLDEYVGTTSFKVEFDKDGDFIIYV